MSLSCQSSLSIWPSDVSCEIDCEIDFSQSSALLVESVDRIESEIRLCSFVELVESDVAVG